MLISEALREVGELVDHQQRAIHVAGIEGAQTHGDQEEPLGTLRFAPPAHQTLCACKPSAPRARSPAFIR